MLSERQSEAVRSSWLYLYNIVSDTVIDFSSGHESGMVERQCDGSFHIRPPR